MASTKEIKFLLTAKNNTKGAFASVKNDLKSMAVGTAQLGGAILGLAGAAGFGLLGVGLVDTNIKFQTLKSSLKTLTGSAPAADAMFDSITKFATTTPFALEEVAGAFIKLKALGLDPSEAAITSYGNTAAAMGKSLNQMIEAVADASTGEFERLKEFGIKAASEGDQVTFTFQGIATTVGKNAAEIEGYLRSIGDVNFGGAMKDQMDNVGPAFDNFKTSIDLLQTAIGEAGLNDAISNTTNSLTDFINALDKTVISESTQASLQAFADVLHAIGDTTDFIGDFIFDANKQHIGGGAGIGGGASSYRLGDFNMAQTEGFETGPAADRMQQRYIDMLRWEERVRGVGSVEAQASTSIRKSPDGSYWWDQTFQDETKKQTTLLERVAGGVEKAIEKGEARAG